MNANKELDATGLSCPMPIVKLAQQIKNMDAGEVLKLIADDPGSQEDVSAWCRRTGNELLEASVDGKDFMFYIKKI